MHPLARRLTAVVAVAGRPRGHRYRDAPSGRREAPVNYSVGGWRSIRTNVGEWMRSAPERAGNGGVPHPCTWGMNGATTWWTEMELTFAVAIPKMNLLLGIDFIDTEPENCSERNGVERTTTCAASSCVGCRGSCVKITLCGNELNSLIRKS